MSYKFRLKDIKALVFDVDGVFTDGSVVLMPDGSMTRTMNVLDGYAVQKAIKKGLIVAIITGGNDAQVEQRMKYLGLTDIYMKSQRKIDDYQDFKAKYQLQDAQILFMGDDLPDYEVMSQVGIAACPTNAVPEIQKIAHYISPLEGGKACVRDVIEQVMKIQGSWIEDHSHDNTQSI
jgi:3-deoxy-D-manno-octulosonate 8-phosphate phosphatase (KDO 8-P phosphatase)